MRLALVVASCLVGATAHAQSFRTYLASYGIDTNPCSVTAPCRLLPAALNAVADGGDIWMLDSANFNGGTVNIPKSVSIQAIPGQVGSLVAVAGAPAVSISTGGVTIRLRNLAFTRNATNPGTYAIEMTAGLSLSVEDSAFTNFVSYAVYPHDFNGRVSVKNTTFTHNSDYAMFGQNGPIMSVMGSHFIQSGGVAALGTASSTTVLTVSDCTFAGSNAAVAVDSEIGTATVKAAVNHSRLENGEYGVYIRGVGPASVALSDVMITGNTHGVFQDSGTVLSAGNNQIVGNGTDVAGTMTTAPLR